MATIALEDVVELAEELAEDMDVLTVAELTPLWAAVFALAVALKEA